MDALEVLFEQRGLPGFGIPAELASLYGGDLGFQRPRVFANFVASVDGVVALPGPAESGGVISQGSEADRFVMGLLRACADTVVIGAGTFRKTPGAFWDAEHIYPPAAEAFAALRKKLGLEQWPRFVVASTSGQLDASQPALNRDAVIATTEAGEALLKAHPLGAQLLVAPDLRGAMAKLRAQGARLILTEGGPTLMGELLQADLLDELFLTRSPALFGRHPGDARKALVDGAALHTPLELIGARRHGSYLFLRYEVSRPA